MNIIFSNGNSKIISFNLSNSLKTWETNLGAEIISPIIIGGRGKNIFVVTRNDNKNGSEIRNDSVKIHSISSKTGITNWQNTLEFMSEAYLFALKNQVIVAGNFGTINSFSTDSSEKTEKPEISDKGELLWSINIEKSFSSVPYLFENYLFVGTSDGKILKINLDGGKIETQTKLSEISKTQTFIKTNEIENVIWVDGKGDVFSQNLQKDKEEWKIRLGGEVTHITTTPKGVLITSLDNFVYLVSNKNGDIIWKKRLNDRITFKPLVIGDFVIISSPTGSSAPVLNLKSGRQVNRIILDEDNKFLSEPHFNGDEIIFPTSKGFLIYNTFSNGCESK